LMKYFEHIEVLSDKKTSNYKRLIDFLDIDSSEFLMVGNSLKSDVLPLIEVGAQAIHVPFHTTWEHEKAEVDSSKESFKTLESLTGILALL
jgi:putative hydrolase of the HAD superfamily